MQSFQNQTLYRATLNTELEAIEELSSNGSIPESVVNILKSDIDSKIAKIAKNNQNLPSSDLKI